VAPFLKVAIALLAGLAFLAAGGEARAGYVSALGFDDPLPVGAMAAEPSWGEGSFQIQPRDDNSPAPDATASEWLGRLLQPRLSGSAPRAGGMGGSGGSHAGGSGPPLGLTANLAFLFDQTSARLFLLYVCHRPPPFRARLFHPPRAPAA
jgi:hypothetical protein